VGGLVELLDLAGGTGVDGAVGVVVLAQSAAGRALSIRLSSDI
jgi:hypothetical protein